MPSILEIALSNLLKSKQISLTESPYYGFISFKLKDDGKARIYKNFLTVRNANNEFNDLLETHHDIVNEIKSTRATKGYLEILIPVLYHGNNREHLGSIDTTFYGLLRIATFNSTVHLTIISPDAYGPDDHFNKLSTTLTNHLHNKDIEVISSTHYLKNKTLQSTIFSHTWLQIYAAKIIENSSSDTASPYNIEQLADRADFEIKRDKLFLIEPEQRTGFQSTNNHVAQKPHNTHQLSLKRDGNSVTRTKIEEPVWANGWSVEMPKPVSAPQNKSSLPITQQHTATNFISTNNDVQSSHQDRNLVTDKKEPDTTISPASQYKIPLVTQKRVLLRDTTLQTILENDLETQIKTLENNIKLYGHNDLWDDKLSALQEIKRDVLPNSTEQTVRKIVFNAKEKYPLATKGLFSGGLLKSRTENIMNKLIIASNQNR